jgi:hypothetical protein
VLNPPPLGPRARLRAHPVGSLVLKSVVFVLGLLFIALGGVLVVLPGPLTIPPVLLGLYIWSTEFAWAERLRARVAVQARVAWEATKRRPIHAAGATVAGLLLVAAALVAVRKYDVIHHVTSSFG